VAGTCYNTPVSRIYLKWILGGLVSVILITLGTVYIQNKTGSKPGGIPTTTTSESKTGGEPGIVPTAPNDESKPDSKPGGIQSAIKDAGEKAKEYLGIYPACPSSMAGILTAPLMEPKYISALTPLGNLNPPGHTSPVDHIYFATEYDGKIPLYAPADAWITQITEISNQDSSGNYVTNGYALTYVICRGLELTFASYTDLAANIKSELAQDKGADCKRGIVKPGHTGGAEGQCYYRVNHKVTSGEEIGWVQRFKRPDGFGYSLPFEIWAADYNTPARSDVNWLYYDDNRYAHAMCTFDLYTGDLRDQFYAKFGVWDDRPIKDENGTTTANAGRFVARTIEPRCGQVNQDIVGTLQGMWFGGPPPKNNESVEFAGKGVAFIHNNIDPTIGELSVGGNFMSAGVISFTPAHAGTTNREFSEVKADGTLYCYPNPETGWQRDGGKVLVQLLDDHHLTIERQDGECSGKEVFIRPYSYER